MNARSFIVVQPDGKSERLTFSPSGVRSEPAHTPKPTRPVGAGAREPAAFDPMSPGWATPPWPTRRVSEHAPSFEVRGDALLLKLGADEWAFDYNEGIAFAARLLEAITPLTPRSGKGLL